MRQILTKAGTPATTCWCFLKSDDCSVTTTSPSTKIPYKEGCFVSETKDPMDRGWTKQFAAMPAVWGSKQQEGNMVDQGPVQSPLLSTPHLGSKTDGCLVRPPASACTTSVLRNKCFAQQVVAQNVARRSHADSAVKEHCITQSWEHG
jgi:hypothetical protein